MTGLLSCATPYDYGIGLSGRLSSHVVESGVIQNPMRRAIATISDDESVIVTSQGTGEHGTIHAWRLAVLQVTFSMDKCYEMIKYDIRKACHRFSVHVDHMEAETKLRTIESNMPGQDCTCAPTYLAYPHTLIGEARAGTVGEVCMSKLP